MAKTAEHLTAQQNQRKKALQDSHEYAREVEKDFEMQKILRRKRTPGQSMTREEFRRKYLAD